MSLNLCILPLGTAENFVSQKCLLPKEIFSLVGRRPGQWSKCWFHPNDCRKLSNFSICQIFPREGDASVCYLDLSVCSTLPNEDKDLILDSIEPLSENQIQLNDIQVSFCLNDDTKSIESISKTYLKSMTQILLQEYHFSTKCIVTSPELQRNGIEGIRIEVPGFEDYCHFILSEDVMIHNENVSLSTKYATGDFELFEVSAFIKARQELDDLMRMSKMQSYSKVPQRMCLNALIVGPVGCGKTSLVEDFLRHYQCNVFRVTSSNVIKQYPGETETEIRRIFKSAQHFQKHFKSKEPTVILMEDLHLLCQQTKSVSSNSEATANAMRILSQILSLVDELFTSRGILCLGTTNDSETLNELLRRPGRFDREILITALTPDDRSLIVGKLFEQNLPSVPSASLLRLVATQTQGYGLADLALLVRNMTKCILTRPQETFESILRESLSKSKPASVRGTDVSVCKTSESFAVIGGMQQLKRILQVSVLAGLKREKSFRRFGLTLPKGLLLYGPPGCSKTTVAKCLANEANMTFIATSGAEVYSPYVGCAEKFIAKIFDTARKNSPCLIFLDEIDSLVGRRSVNASSGDVQIRILSTILTEMDGIIGSGSTSDEHKENAHIIVVAATNRPDMVDDALMRPGRFDKLIHVPAPDLSSRRSILTLYQQRMPFAEDINLDEIASRTNNYSGADVCNLCNEAAMNAFQRDFNTSEICHEDFDYILKTSSKSSLTQSQIDWYYQFETTFLR